MQHYIFKKFVLACVSQPEQAPETAHIVAARQIAQAVHKAHFQSSSIALFMRSATSSSKLSPIAFIIMG